MIMHLSAPRLHSINDGLDKEPYLLHYSTIDDATRLIKAAGRGCYLAKIDLKRAFRLIPIAKCDWELLGIHWDNNFYFNKQLPFGLRSAPFLFNQLADALHWVLTHNYHIHYLVHYLDNFLIVAPSLAACQKAMDNAIALFRRLNIALSWEKVEGPSTCLSFLGIEIDTKEWQLRLPADKLSNLFTELSHWLTKTSCTKRQLLFLIEKLSFATKVLLVGRIFLRCLINLSTKTNSLDNYLHLDVDARADIQWWINLLPYLNGLAPIVEAEWTPSHTFHLFTDASSLHGFGAYFRGAWLRGYWSSDQQLNPNISIAWQELFAIVVAALAWGRLWSGRRILAHCDNLAVVDIWGCYSSKSPPLCL